MSDNKETKKKGFFSRFLGGSNNDDISNGLEKNEVIEDSKSLPKADEASSAPAADDTNVIAEPSQPKVNILSKTALSKMKKADIVSAAAKLGLELDIKLTKEKLLESWNAHFNQQEITEEPKAEAVAEEPVEEITEEPKAEAVAEEPVEEITEEPKAEAVAEEPVEEITEEPKAEAVAEEPVEEITEEPKAEAVAEEPAEETQSKSIKIDEQSPAEIIKTFESKQLKDDIPSFRPGDTVVVSVKVREGDRTRLQAFEGVVMNIKNSGLNSAFIVRKISSGIGVERTFQLHSPMIDSITVKRKGDVRQAKLYYLRERSGRSARIKERLD